MTAHKEIPCAVADYDFDDLERRDSRDFEDFNEINDYFGEDTVILVL